MIKSWLQQQLNNIWYQKQKNWLNFILLPLSYLYQGILTLKNKLVKKQGVKNKVPVVVVGNLTVGGSGKTPAIIALVELAKQQGLRPAVISRGYPLSPKVPIVLNNESVASAVGDEPLLIYKKTQVPVCVCRNRQAAIQALSHLPIDVIFSDDGLQNFSFKHDIEIVLVDETLQFGNQKLLPAGPLREPLTRLKQVDFILTKTFAANPTEVIPGSQPLKLSANRFYSLSGWHYNDLENSVDLNYFKDKKVVAVTGIAQPESFFTYLKKLGIACECYAFNDHYAFSTKDFAPFAEAQIIMTEKDAIKCFVFSDLRFWCLPLNAELSLAFSQAFLARLAECQRQQSNKSA